MIALGFGTAFTMPAATVAIMEAAPADRGGAAAAVFNAARQLGSAIGVALLGVMVAGDFVPGLHRGAVIGALGFVLAALLTFGFIGRRSGNG